MNQREKERERERIIILNTFVSLRNRDFMFNYSYHCFSGWKDESSLHKVSGTNGDQRSRSSLQVRVS